MAQINKPEDYFNTKLYTGNGSTNAITGVGFQPDLVWMKRRDSSASHNWEDAVRGAGKNIRSDTTDAEVDSSGTFGITSFDSDGFSLTGSGGRTNASSGTYASWNWLGQNGTSSNTDGSITSTVSANTTAGFSIVSYTGNNTDGATVGHGLGTTPAMTIIKNRSTSATNWIVKHQDLPSGNNVLFLDSMTSTLTNGGGYQSHNSTTVTMNIGTSNLIGINGSGDNYVMYCFAEKKGYSKFGSYEGNGSTDGPFIYTGFKPAFVIVKGIDDNSRQWIMFDNKRNSYNPENLELRPDSDAAEVTQERFFFLSNGIKVTNNLTYVNALNETYIYMAFAESPLVGTNNIPTTGR